MKDTLQMKETIIKQLEERINHMDLLQGQEGKKIQEYQEYNQKIASEKKQLEKDLEEMRVKYETFRPIQVMLKSPHFDKFISVRNGKASATSKSGPDETFTIVKHPNGMFSFQTNSLPIAYLSLTDSLGFTSSETCGSREKFWLHNSGEAATYIESVHFPGRFLTALVSDSGLLCWKGGKVPESSIYIIVC
ncbi:hypothetical protein BDZ91DRAFT_746599 [Kalaharituber pfeilii]|nr:hypothetical protein BDZ91DRAFT_746599 [Kalaharituber pfeilii]